jgi:hypothetical protein
MVWHRERFNKEEMIKSKHIFVNRINIPNRIHPILNIAHLEKYQLSPAKFGNQPTKSLNHADFEELPEYEVEMIIMDRRKKGRKGRFVMEYLTQFKGYNANLDKWLNLKQLKNAPEYS